MFKSPSIGWQLAARMLRLFNDHHEAGLASKSAHTRDATAYIANYVREQVAPDRSLVWC